MVEDSLLIFYHRQGLLPLLQIMPSYHHCMYYHFCTHFYLYNQFSILYHRDVNDPINYAKTLNKSLDALSLDRPGSALSPIPRYARSMSAGRQRAARPSSASRPASAAPSAEISDDSEYLPQRRPDLEIDGGTLSISSRPQNPARKTRANDGSGKFIFKPWKFTH